MTRTECSATEWYALQARPNYEQTVAATLDRIAVEKYLRLHQRAFRARQNRPGNRVSLFPGYVFANLNLDHGPRMYSIRGVVRILGNGLLPRRFGPKKCRHLRRSQVRISPFFLLSTSKQASASWLSRDPYGEFEEHLYRSRTRTYLLSHSFLLRRAVDVAMPRGWFAPTASYGRWFSPQNEGVGVVQSR